MPKLFAQTTLAFVVALGFGGVALAQTTTKIKIADSFPVGHYLPKYITTPMMEKLKANPAAKGIEFEYYPAEQMGKAKDFLSLVQSGVIDIAYVAPGFVSDKMPLSVVSELPLDFSGSCQATMAYWNLAKPGGLLDKKEFAPNGVRLLFTIVLPPYQIITRKPFANLKEIEGMKIRASGSAKELVIKKLKAIPGADADARRLRVALARHDRRRPVPVQQPGAVRDPQALEDRNDRRELRHLRRQLGDQREALPEPAARRAAGPDGDGRAAHEAACTQVEKDEAGDIEKVKAAGVKLTPLSAADKATVADGHAGRRQGLGRHARQARQVGHRGAECVQGGAEVGARRR